MGKSYDKIQDEDYIINIVKLDEVDEIVNNHIYSINKTFGSYLLRCEFVVEFDKKIHKKYKHFLNP